MVDVTSAATRYLFFTGKGGVGKTSVACATAIRLADQGHAVLLVSTDPASNLDEVLGVALASTPTRLAGVPNLSALNIDPEAAARAYRQRIVEPYRGVLPEASVASIEEQLSGACTVEIAAFDEFSRLLGDPLATAEFDHVVFDTAPTGHTLRLLRLPAAWNGFLENNTTGTSCLGPLAGLQQQRTLYKATLDALNDARMTTVVLVSRLDQSALNEAARSHAELADLGAHNQRLVLNGVFRATDAADPVARSWESRQRTALGSIPPSIAALPRMEIALKPAALIGVPALRQLFDPAPTDSRSRVDNVDSGRNARRSGTARHLEHLVAEIARNGRGAIMTMGKGGVGKTTIASAIAVALAQRGHRVHLTTTDPAAHLDLTLATRVPRLEVGRIDPVVETERYRQQVIASAAKDLDERGRQLLDEDLRSPCTEEIAVFRAFAARLDKGMDGFVVLDTAPTGHTLLLLDATEAYHREVLRTNSDLPQAVRDLLPRLRDPDFTKVLLVTLPEATPVHEARQLQDDLRRARIAPHAWVINQSLTPLEIRDPLLRARQAAEARYIHQVESEYSARTTLVPWISDCSNDNWA